MPGGIMQLKAYGVQNQYLTGNPQFTFFRAIYKRHTNFSMEVISTPLQGPTELSLDNPIKLSTTIDRNGDLVSNMYFVFELPDIYSGYNTSLQGTIYFEEAGRKFAWINSIGTNIIRTCKLSIGGQTINTLYGEWIRIWHELFSTYDMRTFDEMVGNLPELFLPSTSVGAGGYYPTSTLNSTENEDPEQFSLSEFLTNPYLKAPSIRGRTITVPLNLWFTSNPGLSLPLIALQYHSVAVDIELRPLSQLYTIYEFDEVTKKGYKTTPDMTNPFHTIQNFISSKDSTNFNHEDDTLSAINEPYNGWGFNARLLINYIFLDEDERKRFADVTHEYLIDQVIQQSFTGFSDIANIDLKLQNPVKNIIFLAERDDFENQNIFGNYTNWEIPAIDPSSSVFIKKNVGEFSFTSSTTSTENAIGIDLAYQAFENDEIPHKFNFNQFNKQPIKTANIFFNGQPRFGEQTSDFFQNTQIYQHKFQNSMDGVLMYSFSLEPTKYQPSGSCNFSRIQSIHLNIKFNDIPYVRQDNNELQPKYKYNVTVYSINYNIFRIIGGMGGLSFSS